ncbi:MAG: ComF family protein [candidate division Zixibacteria bacterium]|nr:ComF family protein [candidate division Zixibacteria bacterium]
MLTGPVAHWMETALEFVFPPLCLSCGAARDSEQLLCPLCARAVQYLEYPICLKCAVPITAGITCATCTDSVPLFALGDHVGSLQQMVIAFKFRNVYRVAGWAASELAARQRDRLEQLGVCAVVPVPLHPRREYMRGYNQAELFGSQLADKLDVDLRADLIIRTKHRRAQSRLSGSERAKNIKGVFTAEPTDERQDGILLVDDVVTSGATVSEAIRTLSEAGHGVVAVAAIAHRG